MNEEMIQADFADFLGVTRGYVSQLKKGNRLVLSDDGKRVRVRETLDMLAATGNVDKVGVSARHALERLAKGGSGVNVQEAVQAAAAGLAKPPAGSIKTTTVLPDAATLLFTDPMAAYNAARAGNEIKRGEQLDIDLAKSRRELIGLDGAIKAVAGLAAATRARIERMPDRIATVLAAETDPVRVYEILQQEIDSICAEIQQAALGLPDKLS